MRNLFIALLVVTTLCLTAIVALAVDPDNATAVVTVTVDVIGEWAKDFNTIALSAITAQGTTPTGSGATRLYTNGNVSITADQTAAARLDKIGDANQTLVTSYMLTDDGEGGSETGGTDETEYTTYDDFLDTPYAITHAAGDGEVQIILNVKAANPPGGVADAGNYSALQTLTATW